MVRFISQWPENEPYYAKEIEWLNTRQFSNDMPLDQNGGILHMLTASENYASLWNRYKIEIVLFSYIGIFLVRMKLRTLILICSM